MVRTARMLTQYAVFATLKHMDKTERNHPIWIASIPAWAMRLTNDKSYAHGDAEKILNKTID